MLEKYPPVLVKTPEAAHVLTNRIQLYGAAVLLYPGLMKLCETHVGKDFLIIPSSVNEIFLFPATGIENAIVSHRLADLIQHVNMEEIPADERLSNHAYRYCSAEDKVICI